MLRTSKFLRKQKNYLLNFVDLTFSPHASISSYLSRNNINIIFDVGANVGQFGIDMRSAGFKGKILSYEPASAALIKLHKTAFKYPPWEVFPVALGSLSSTNFLNISGNSGLSSSILEMDEVHLHNFPKSLTVGREEVLVSTFDSQLSMQNIDPRGVLLKIDVQGYEHEVLKGAKKNLSKTPYCFLEVSLTPLYKNESSLLQLLNYLDEFGHDVVDIFRGTKSSNGDLLQIDILTKRRVS